MLKQKQDERLTAMTKKGKKNKEKLAEDCAAEAALQDQIDVESQYSMTQQVITRHEKCGSVIQAILSG
jgi:hypothetical protein